MATSLELATRLSAVVVTQQEVLAAITDRDRVLELVVERVPEATNGDGAVVEMVDGPDLVYRAASGIARKHVGLRLTREGSLSGRCITEKMVMRADDTETDPRVDAAACRAVGIRSMLIAPLLEANVAIGALKTFSTNPNAFVDLDMFVLQLLGGMTSSALTQSMTFRERQASEERYRLLFESNVAGVFRSTMDGRILDCNDSLARYLGYDTRDELLALSAWDLYHQRSDREEFLQLVQQNGSMLNMRMPMRRKDGSSLLGLISVSLVPGERNETHLLGTVVEA